MNAATLKATHKSSVTAILGGNTRAVHSHGTSFYNRDRWTGRALLVSMCKDIESNPSKPLTPERVWGWVEEANGTYVYQPSITIADTPAEVNDRTASALIGGAYHEAWHTKYSCRRNLTVAEVMAIVAPRWAKVQDWKGATKLLLEWSNIIEDVRIERLGCAAYPGTHTKMCDLQDFILDLEAKGNAAARAHGVEVNGTLSVIGKTFRDLGLGYNTESQRAALASYKADNAQAFGFVVTTLRPLLDEAVNMSEADDLGCLRVAFDVLIAIADAAQPQPQQGQQGDEGGESGESGEGGKSQKADGKDNKAKGKDKGKKEGGKKEGGKKEEAEANGGDAEAEGDGEGGEAEGEGKGAEGEAEGKGKGEGAEGEDADGEAEGEGGEAEGDAEGEGEGEGAESGGDSTDKGKTLADSLKEGLEKGESMGMKDNNTALSEAFQQAEEAKTRKEGGVQAGEAVYRPADKSLDRVVPIAKSRSEGKRAEADKLLSSVKEEVSYLRARLRNVFRAAEMTGVVHGVSRGRTLSERMLVDSKVALMGGMAPSRAYMQRDEQQDMSLACAIVLDQSGSMSDKLVEATQAMLAIAEPMDAIGGKVMAVGFRDGQSFNGDRYADKGLEGCHQYDGVDIDVFKGFDERFASVKARFACTRSVGGTPMANGVQHALDALNNRREGHRVLFVITDGEPSWGHGPVVKRQIRIAKEAGIHVIGVGIGYGAHYVTKLFPDHVFSPDMKGLSQQLVEKVNGIVDRAARKRGVRMAG